MTRPSDQAVRFRSVRHPGAVSAPVAFGAFLVRPIGATMLPVMVVGVVLVLQQYDPLPFVLWAAPLALGLAALWTWYRFRTVIVEFVVSNNGAAALSVIEAVRERQEPGQQRVFDVRTSTSGAQITVGRASYELEADEWPELPRMIDLLLQAKAFYD